MTHLQKLRVGSILKWVCSNASETRITRCTPAITQHPRFYGRKKEANEPDECGDSNRKFRIRKRVSNARMSIAKGALQEYLYSTRNMQFLDAENMSKNSPKFVKNLLKKTQHVEDVGRAMRLLFRYHPINEFEPFFESLGLKPFEYAPLLQQGMMFLNDDPLLLENYHVLCNYGIAPRKIGKIYLEAREIFQYDYGVLKSKLLGYEKLGLSQSTVAMVMVCSPAIFIGDVNADFVKVYDKLKRFGLEFSWMEKVHLFERSHNWGQMLELLDLFSKIVSSEEQVGEVFRHNPGLLLYASRKWTLLLIGFLLKFGCTMNQLHSLFLQFPQINVENFVSNLRQSFLFLNYIEMDTEELHEFIRTHPLILGSCKLKKPSRLQSELKVSKQRLRDYVKENPLELKKWVVRARVEPLPDTEEEKVAEKQKAKFLSDMKIDEDSCNRKGVFKKLKFKDLQERFDTIVKAGLDPEDVAGMVRCYPELLQRSKDSVQSKIDYLVNSMGYPVSTLLAFPLFLRLSPQRVKLRSSMYNWLKEEGLVNTKLSAATLMGSSDECFIKWYVTKHPRGLEVWEDMKKQIYSE